MTSLVPVPTAPRLPSPAADLLRAEQSFGGACLGVLPFTTGGSVFSPLSVFLALAMVLQGARGRTAEELSAALRLPGQVAGVADWRELTGSLTGVDSGGADSGGADSGGADSGEAGGGAAGGGVSGADVVFRLANTAWVQAGLSLRDGFVDTLRDGFDGALHAADFASDADGVRQRINTLIAEQTAQRITELLGPGQVGAGSRLVLANAVYLKARWARPFNPHSTQPGPFSTADGGVVEVSMMRQTARFGYARGSDHQAVTLPYVGGRLAMTVLLPDGPLAPLRDRVARAGVGPLLADVRPEQVDLSLPRFQHTARYDLADGLRALGVRQVFTDQADLTGITDTEPLKLDLVVHEAFVAVDEHGTEAAAATATVLRSVAAVISRPIRVVVDRPFLFAITDTTTGALLFLGDVVRP